MSYSETKGGEILNYTVDPAITVDPAGYDLLKNRIVELTGDHQVAYGAAQEPAHGVAICGGNAGERIDVQTEGVTQIVLESNVGAGDLISAGTDGKGKVAGGGDYVIGQAIEDGVTDQVIAVRIDRHLV